MQQSNQNISSKYILDHISASIVNAAKVIQIEKGCTVDESIEIIRKFLVKSQNELMNKNISDRLHILSDRIELSIKNNSAGLNDREIYRILKDIGVL